MSCSKEKGNKGGKKKKGTGSPRKKQNGATTAQPEQDLQALREDLSALLEDYGVAGDDKARMLYEWIGRIATHQPGSDEHKAALEAEVKDNAKRATKATVRSGKQHKKAAGAKGKKVKKAAAAEVQSARKQASQRGSPNRAAGGQGGGQAVPSATRGGALHCCVLDAAFEAHCVRGSVLRVRRKGTHCARVSEQQA